MSPMRMMLAVALALATFTDFGFAAGGKAAAGDAPIRHFGLGRNLQGTSDKSIYHSKRVREKPGDAAGVLPDFPCETVMELGAGLSARIPHLLRADAEGTLPRAADAKVEAMNPDRPQGWSPSPSDRSVRLATVIEAWNVLQHFYPYWDVIDTDWPAQLRRSLSQAAEVEGRDGLQQVLAELVAAARDGHGNLVSGGGGAMVPVVAEWVEGKLVVIHAPDQTGFQPGDIIASIDRTSVGETVHQGVGVKPTVPCERTIAGAAACRDELLEKAVEALEGG